MPKGLLFGPDLRRSDRPDLPPKFKKTKKTKRKVTSRSKGESRSKVQRDRKRVERKKKREDRLLMRAKRREEEQQRKAVIGEPVVTKVANRDAKSHHGTEQVDATIVKLLGRSHKSQKRMAPKSKDKKVEEVAGPKWRHGMREERHESRSVKAKPPKKTSEKSKAKATVSEESVISSEQLNQSFSREAGAAGSGEILISSERETNKQPFSEQKTSTVEERQPKAGVQQDLPTVDVGPDYEADKVDWAEEKQSKLVPIADVGPDFEADGGVCSSGDGAAELPWPLPIQAPLEPMPPCMAFYQVRRQ